MTDKPKEEKKHRPGQFQPGFDPRRNLSARNKREEGHDSIPRMCRMHCVEAVERAVDLMRNSKNERVVAAAINIILERGLGKAKTTIEIEGQVDHVHSMVTIDPKAISQEMRLQLLAARIDELEQNEPIRLADYSEVDRFD